MRDTIINVRRAVPDDIPDVRMLFRDMMLSIYPDREPEPYEEGYLDKFFGGADRIYIAEINYNTAAYISVEVYDEYIYLDDLCVSAICRGRGLGTELIRAAEKYAADNNIPAAVLHVERANLSAYRLYKKHGYTLAAEEGSRLKMKKLI